MPRAAALVLLLLLYGLCAPLQARMVYRCVQKGTVSMATAPAVSYTHLTLPTKA